ncbi:hypothetical protein LIER_22554 [Lithospermum erythrorhizon]|uniref:Glutamic acid-rich protein-like n=2 Tax=Lithospermum erythrorhizon TaxID=34254 RepID=A0AAV3QXQ6_LITER
MMSNSVVPTKSRKPRMSVKQNIPFESKSCGPLTPEELAMDEEYEWDHDIKLLDMEDNNNMEICEYCLMMNDCECDEQEEDDPEEDIQEEEEEQEEDDPEEDVEDCEEYEEDDPEEDIQDCEEEDMYADFEYVCVDTGVLLSVDYLSMKRALEDDHDDDNCDDEEEDLIPVFCKRQKTHKSEPNCDIVC